MSEMSTSRPKIEELLGREMESKVDLQPDRPSILLQHYSDSQRYTLAPLIKLQGSNNSIEHIFFAYMLSRRKIHSRTSEKKRRAMSYSDKTSRAVKTRDECSECAIFERVEGAPIHWVICVAAY